METLGFAGKMRKRHAETTRPSGKYGLSATARERMTMPPPSQELQYVTF
jgi:hypothetical protein